MKRMIICKSCGKEKELHALSMCSRCYYIQYRIDHRDELAIAANLRYKLRTGLPEHYCMYCDGRGLDEEDNLCDACSGSGTRFEED